MPCLLLLFALIAPRLVLVVLWLFTRWFRGIFAIALWPVLGFIFLPTTLLWYTAVQPWFGGPWTFWPVAGRSWRNGQAGHHACGSKPVVPAIASTSRWPQHSGPSSGGRLQRHDLNLVTAGDSTEGSS